MIQDTELKIVTEVINAWDPIRLISGGAPLMNIHRRLERFAKNRLKP